MANTRFKKGQFIICRYAGAGDILVGRIESVRRTGHVILTNLITGNRVTRDTAGLHRRHRVATKAEVEAVLAVHEKKGVKTARQAAEGITKARVSKRQLPLPFTEKPVEEKPTAPPIPGGLREYLDRSNARKSDEKVRDFSTRLLQMLDEFAAMTATERDAALLLLHQRAGTT